MRAALGDAALAQHHDLVGLHGRTQPVGDDEQRTARALGAQLPQCPQDLRFGARVHRRQRVVQQLGRLDPASPQFDKAVFGDPAAWKIVAVRPRIDKAWAELRVVYQAVKAPEPKPAPPQVPASASAATTPAKKKRSNKEQREYAALPAKIEALEAEDKALQDKINSPEFYKSGSENIRIALERVETLRAELEAAYERWTILDELTV